MAALFFRNHEITIYRTRRKTGTDRYAFSATLTGYSSDIQPSSIERQEMLEGRFGAVYDAYVNPEVDIKEGDEVVDGDGKRYSVRGVTKWHGAGLLDHKELILVSKDSNT